MEFITVEQFKEQPKEVQKVFLDWWKPSIGDIYCNEFLLNFDGDRIQKLEVVTNMTDVDYIKDVSEFLCVLLTEGQLRVFIEDKTNGVVKNTQWHIEDDGVSKRGYSIYLLTKNDYDVMYHYKDLGEDLLKAYWKVACMIAKEEVDGH